MCARCSNPRVSKTQGFPSGPRLLASGWFWYESSSMKQFLVSTLRPSYSFVSSYTGDCSSWMLMHFAFIHSLRSDENGVISVNLFGSAFCGHPNRAICGSIMKLFGRRDCVVIARTTNDAYSFGFRLMAKLDLNASVIPECAAEFPEEQTKWE